MQCINRWVQKNHPRTCDPVRIPTKKGGDEYRSTSVLYYINELHNPSPESDDGDSDYYEDFPGINIDIPSEPYEDASNGSSNNNTKKENGLKSVDNDRTRTRFPFRLFGCIKVQG